MNEITMIPIGLLHHHPENPRLDLGDLTELTESIRANGIMQNLTVVRGHAIDKKEWIRLAKAEGVNKAEAEATWEPSAYDQTGYTVVIGNRRMEAAKLAGLAEVPCVIREMDRKTQISTMLMENMQRADLTVYEQAQGFQMMMDLGFSAKEIGEKTGFGETTVRRRLKMAELDPKLLKKKCEEKDSGVQITLADFEQLAQVESLKERNALLKDMGDSNYRWQIKRTLNRQKAQKVKPAAKRILKEAGAEPLPKDKEYSSEYQKIYNATVRMYEWEEGQKLLPDTQEKVFWLMDDDSCYFYYKNKPQKKDKKPEKTEEEKAREKEIADAWKTIGEDEQTARKLREEFVGNMNVNQKNAMWMFQWLLMASALSVVNYQSPREKMMELIGVPENVPWDDRIPKSIDGVLGLKAGDYPKVILAFFESCCKDGYRNGNYKGQKPVYKKNRVLDLEYEWLCSMGYTMSLTETQMQTGKHTAYMEVADDEQTGDD